MKIQFIFNLYLYLINLRLIYIEIYDVENRIHTTFKIKKLPVYMSVYTRIMIIITCYFESILMTVAAHKDIPIF